MSDTFNSPRRVLVTGASGFIGRAVCAACSDVSIDVVAAVRESGRAPIESVKSVSVGDIGFEQNWSEALRDVNVVVHLAAHTHRLRRRGDDTLEEYRRVNVEATEALARQALVAGVQRFVFMSSIKVNGEMSEIGSNGTPRLMTADDSPRPEDAYGQTKWEAEEVLREVVSEGGMQLVVLRPPAIYGPGQKANMLRLFELIERGIPLPLAAVTNRRSFIYSGNLAGAVIAATSDGVPAGTYTLDDIQISTPELIRAVASAIGSKPRLWWCPPSWLRGLATITGYGDLARKLTGSLVVESKTARNKLNWSPDLGFEEALRKTARWFRSRKL